MFTVGPAFFGGAVAPSYYLLDEFAGTGSMDAWAPESGYDTGNWVNGLSGVVYFTERVGGFLVVKSPDVTGQLVYGTDPAASSVVAPFKLTFEFNTGLEASAFAGAPRLLLQLITSTHSTGFDISCYNGTNINASVLYDGSGADNSDVSFAWETTYVGTLTVVNGNQTLTVMGASLVSAGTWDAELTYTTISLTGGAKLGRVVIEAYTPP